MRHVSDGDPVGADHGLIESQYPPYIFFVQIERDGCSRLQLASGLLFRCSPLRRDVGEIATRVVWVGFAAGDEDAAAEHAAVSKSKFDKLDTNMDGNLTAAEVTAHHKQSGKAPMATGDWIKQKDTHGDGMISTSEHVTSAESRFAKLDANGDGNLPQDELDAGRMAATEY